MGIEENENMGFDHQHRCSDDTLLNFPSSGMNTNPVSVWDPIVSLSHNENFAGSSVIPHSDFGIGNQGMVHYQTDTCLGEMVSKLPCYGNRSFPEKVGSFGLAECGQISTMRYPQNYAIDRSPINGGVLKGDQQVSEAGEKEKSRSGKGKKRGSESNSPQSQNKGEQMKDMSCDNSPEQPNEHDEKRQKIEHNLGTNLRGKQTGKQVKDGSNNDDLAKDNYIHVRARRGQATNSHSLAERVRRERISERMKLLQELVPGCNKITGKAVMLDEIINYVQSLQQQVEFLSMKLATVNPEINIDIDRILSKELLHPRGNVAIPGFVRNINSPHPYPPSMSQGLLHGLSNASEFHQMPQNVWDNEIHNLLQMGFDPNHAINNIGSSAGRPKLDL